jgi:hypothetical protein
MTTPGPFQSVAALTCLSQFAVRIRLPTQAAFLGSSALAAGEFVYALWGNTPVGNGLWI